MEQKFIDIRDLQKPQEETKAWADLLLYFIDSSLEALYSFHPRPEPTIYLPQPAEVFIHRHLPHLYDHEYPVFHRFSSYRGCTLQRDFPLLEIVVAAKYAPCYMGRTSNPLVHRLNLQQLPTSEQLIGVPFGCRRPDGKLLDQFPDLLIK